MEDRSHLTTLKGAYDHVMMEVTLRIQVEAVASK